MLTPATDVGTVQSDATSLPRSAPPRSAESKHREDFARAAPSPPSFPPAVAVVPPTTRKKKRKEQLKVFLLYGFLFGILILMSKYVPRLLHAARDPVRSIPAKIAIPVYIVFSIVRYCTIIPYYFFPVGSLFTWYMSVQFDNHSVGAFWLVFTWGTIYTCCQPPLRRIWTEKISQLLDGEDIWYLPKGLKEGINGLDHHWQEHAHGKGITDAENSPFRLMLRQASLVLVLDNAWGTGGILFSQVWIATRTTISVFTFALGIWASQALFYPRAKIVLTITAEITNDPNSNLILDTITDFWKAVIELTIPEIIIAIGMPLVCTTYYQGANLRILCGWIKRKYKKAKDKRRRRRKLKGVKCSKEETESLTGSPGDSEKSYGSTDCKGRPSGSDTKGSEDFPEDIEMCSNPPAAEEDPQLENTFGQRPHFLRAA